jgi:hypothetical protein
MTALRFPHKRIYDSQNLCCTFCSKRGHTRRGCLGVPTVPTKEQKHPFFDTLISSPTVDVTSVFEGLSLADALTKLKMSGEIWNYNNPVGSSTNRQNLLRSKLGFWKALGAGPSVISWLAYGLPCNFQVQPRSYLFKNHTSYFDNIDFCEKEITTHVLDGCFVPVAASFPLVVSPQQVEFNSNNKPRRCDDCRWVNAHLAHTTFTMETLAKTVPHVVKPHDKLFSLDLEKAYYKLSLHPAWHRYICFEHKQQFFSSSVLLFGLGPAPFWFTKVNRPVLAFFRTLLISVVNYIDDFLFSESVEKVDELLLFVLHIFTLLGWLINSKSVLIPTEVLLFLGLLIDTELFKFLVPEQKLLRVESFIRRITEKARNKEPVDVTDIRSITGFCVSLSLAVPPIMLWVRLCHFMAPESLTSPTKILSEQEITSLEQIPAVLRKNNGNPIVPSDRAADFTFFLDAGEIGIGAVLDNTAILTEPLPAKYIGKSSTFRELFTAVRLLNVVGKDNKGKKFHLKFDSFNAVRNIFNYGANQPANNKLVLQLWRLQQQFDIELFCEWIPRKINMAADAASKFWDQIWHLSAATLAAARKVGGFRCEVLSPKFTRIGPALTSVTQRTVIIHPIWVSQSWWPLLQKMKRKTVYIGSFTDTFTNTPSRTLPPWEFAATLVCKR